MQHSSLNPDNLISLEQLTASIPGVVYQFKVTQDGAWEFVYISQGINELFEVSAEEAYNDHNSMTSCITDEDRADHRRSVEEAVRTLSPWVHEHRIITRRSATLKWIRGSALPYPQDDGSVLWSGILTDISDYMQLKLWQQQQSARLEHELAQQQQARNELQQQWERLLELLESRNRQLDQSEQSLQRSREFMERIINSLIEPLFIKDESFRYIMINDASCKLAGLSCEQIIGKTDHDFLPIVLSEHALQKDLQVLHSGASCCYDLEFRDRNGVIRTMRVNKLLYTDPEGCRFLVGTMRDITEQIQAEQQKSHYAQHLSGAIEQERARLARELHDMLGHALTEQSFRLRQVQRIAQAAQGAELRDSVKQLQQGIDRMVRMVQQLCSGLRPSLLDELGLAAAVEWLGDELHKNGNISCTINWYADINLTADESIELFRIVQESLNNVVKHAHATNVSILFSSTDQSSILEIIDNGCGFDPSQQSGRRSFGIIGMQERALVLGGQLSIQSRPDAGTTIRLVIPSGVTAQEQPPCTF